MQFWARAVDCNLCQSCTSMTNLFGYTFFRTIDTIEPNGDESDGPNGKEHHLGAMKATAGNVEKLKASIEDHFKSVYEFDPHFTVIAASQRYFSRQTMDDVEEGEQEREDGEHLCHVSVLLMFCFATQSILFYALLSGHIYADKDAEQSTFLFKVATFGAIAAFIAEATIEWKEVFHLLEAAMAGCKHVKHPMCLAFSVLTIVPKLLFAVLFTFYAPFMFLDASRKTDVILNSTALLFLLNVDNQLFKALGGLLEGRDLEVVAEHVQKYWHPIPTDHLRKELTDRAYEKYYQHRIRNRRQNQRIGGFAISCILSMAGAWWFWNHLANWTVRMPTSAPAFPSQTVPQ